MTMSIDVREPDTPSLQDPEANRWYRRPIRTMWSLFRRQEGAIAVEFALVAPFLTIGLLAVGLISEQVYKRIVLEQIARVGVEAALTNADPSVVIQRMKTAASAKGLRARYVFDDPEPGMVILDAGRGCYCPKDTRLPNDRGGPCVRVCNGGRPPALEYLISVRQDYTEQEGFWNGLGIFQFAVLMQETGQFRRVLIR